MRDDTADVRSLERALEGPGSDARLRQLQRRFRAVGGARRAWMSKPIERARLGLALWLTAWATTVGGALYLFFGR